MLFVRKISSKDAIIYVIVQCIGAVIGAGVLLLIASGMPGYSITQNGLGQNGYGASSPAGFTLTTNILASARANQLS